VSTVLPGQQLAIIAFLDALDSIPPGGVAPWDVDQDAIEAVAPAHRNQRVGEGFTAEEDLVGFPPAPHIEEVVSQRQLAHHRDMVRCLVLHRQCHALFAVHAILPFQRPAVRTMGDPLPGTQLEPGRDRPQREPFQ